MNFQILCFFRTNLFIFHIAVTFSCKVVLNINQNIIIELGSESFCSKAPIRRCIQTLITVIQRGPVRPSDRQRPHDRLKKKKKLKRRISQEKSIKKKEIRPFTRDKTSPRVDIVFRVRFLGVVAHKSIVTITNNLPQSTNVFRRLSAGIFSSSPFRSEQSKCLFVRGEIKTYGFCGGDKRKEKKTSVD